MQSDGIHYDASLSRMDLETFQQRVIEAFELYTGTEYVHKSDLLDLLEDVGIHTKDADLEVAIQAELADDDGQSMTEKLTKFDLDDVQAIALRFFLARKQGSTKDIAAEGPAEEEVGILSFLFLTLTCRKKKGVEYSIRRPSCDVDLTPKQVLMIGAGVVLILMCLFVLAVISIMWIQGTVSSEKTTAIRTAVILNAVSTEIIKEEVADRHTSVGDAVDLFRKVLRESYQRMNRDDARSLNNKVLRVGEFLNDLMDGRRPEHIEILAGVAVLKKVASFLEVRGANASGFLQDVGIPAINSLRHVSGGGANWNVVVANTSGAAPLVLSTVGNCSVGGACAYSGNPCVQHSGTADRYRTFSTMLPTPGVNGTYVATQLDADGLQLTACLFKPHTQFRAEYYSRIMPVYRGTFEGLLTWRVVNFNILDGTAHPIVHYTPLETAGVPSTNCDGGCEEVYARSLTTQAAGNCSIEDQCRLYGVPQGVLAVDLIDNSSTQVSCASSSIGAPMTLNLQMFLCRITQLMKTENTETMRTTINTVNAGLKNMSKVGVLSTLELSLFSRDSTGTVTQLTDYASPSDCIGTCTREVELLTATDAVFDTLQTTAAIVSDYHPRPTVQGVGYIQDLELVLMAEHSLTTIRSNAATELITSVFSRVSEVSDVEVVAVSRSTPYISSPTYLPTDACTGTTKCLTRLGYGVVYRSDCEDCVRGTSPGPIYSLSNISGCPAPCDLSGWSLYSKPFTSPSTDEVKAGEPRSGHGGSTALYIALYLPDISLGVVMHFDISQRYKEVYEGFAIGYSSFVGLIVVALLSFWFISRRNLDALEGEWLSYKKQIRSESVAFASVVTSVLPAAYVPLLFLEAPRASDRMNLALMFLNVAGFQKLVSGKEPAQIHDHVSYMFHVMRTVVTHLGLYSVKTFGDCMFVVGGLLRKHTAVSQDASATESFTASEAALTETRGRDGASGEAKKTPSGEEGGSREGGLGAEAASVRCIEAASIILQLVSHLYEHTPRKVDMLKKHATVRELQEVGALRVGVSMGSSLCFVSRVAALPKFEVMGEYVSVAHRLQQAAKVNSINITREVKGALQRSGEDANYVLAKDRTMMYRRAVIHTTLITQGRVRIPERLMASLNITRATPRLFFDELGGLQYTSGAGVPTAPGGTIAGERSTISSGSSNQKPQ